MGYLVSMSRHRATVIGFLVGLAATLLLAAHVFWVEPRLSGRARLFERLEYQSFDFRINHCNTLGPASPLVHLDIDDNALARVGRWPWKRRDVADLIRVTTELGARSILIDLLFDEPEQVSISDPAYSGDADIEGPAEVVGELSDANRVFDDLELAEAIRASGRVILSVQGDVPPPGEQSVRRRVESLLRGGESDWQAIARRMNATTAVGREIVRREVLRARAATELSRRFTLGDAELAAALGANVDEVREVIAGAKSRAAAARMRELFQRGQPTLAEAMAAILGDAKDSRTADRRDVVAAYREALGWEALRPAMIPLPDEPSTARAAEEVLKNARLGSIPHRAGNLSPVYFLIGRAAADIGAVNFRGDSDGVVRRVPPLIRTESGLLRHLGVAGACRELGIAAVDLELSGDNELVFGASLDMDGRVAAPLDAGENLIIHWTNTARKWRQGEDFPHISAAKAWSIVDARRQVAANETTMAYILAEIVSAARGEATVETGSAGGESKPESIAGDATYRQKVNDQLKLAREAHLARLRGERPDAQIREMEQRAAALKAEIRAEQEQAISAVEAACAELESLTPEELAADAALKADYDKYMGARRLITGDLAQLKQANARLQESADTAQRELAPRLKDQIVLLGYAATAQGDIVSTPIDPVTNGVMCHAHVLNSLLQRRFVRTTGTAAGAAAFIVLGGLVSLITARLGPWRSLLATAGLLGAFGLFNALWLFQRRDVWFPLAGPIVAGGVAWAAVTLFRQLTAEKDRRMFARQLSTYTSPAIAAKIAESPAAMAAFKTVQTRDVTCLFSDLAGFTTISEQQDAEVVQLVLNTYLRRMSEVIWAQRGLINKFMGDGIMAFFNPSVDPMPEHPRVACETALLMLEALDALKGEHGTGAADGVFQQLDMRIGLATGLAKNGDLGSDLKADYTVIGDVVNLAARLEPANKVFGTKLMISGPTREVVKDAYEFRYLAELQVKGKKTTVPVHELIGRRGTLTEDQRAYIERFEAGVALYKAMKWDECIVHFTRMLARRPDDAGASRYIDACQEFKQFPPDEGEWRGALELKEK